MNPGAAEVLSFAIFLAKMCISSRAVVWVKHPTFCTKDLAENYWEEGPAQACIIAQAQSKFFSENCCSRSSRMREKDEKKMGESRRKMHSHMPTGPTGLYIVFCQLATSSVGYYFW